MLVVRSRWPITISAGMSFVKGGLKRKIRFPSVSATQRFPFTSKLAEFGSQIVLAVVPPVHLRPMLKFGCPRTTLAAWALVTPEALGQIRPRSEERRVGKECRSRWGTDK